MLQWGSAVQHVTDHDRAEEAHEHASELHRAYLKTPVASFNATHHHVHHRYAKQNVNMNLNPGADILLGAQRRADMNDALEMNFQKSL